MSSATLVVIVLMMGVGMALLGWVIVEYFQERQRQRPRKRVWTEDERERYRMAQRRQRARERLSIVGKRSLEGQDDQNVRD